MGTIVKNPSLVSLQRIPKPINYNTFLIPDHARHDEPMVFCDPINVRQVIALGEGDRIHSNKDGMLR